MVSIFLQLTESDKRILFALLLVLILVLLLLWYIGYLITRIMKRQSKKIDAAVSDAVRNKVITDPSHFRKYAHKKNWQIFYKKSKFSILIILIGAIILLIQETITQFTYNPFSNENGFGTILFKFDLSSVEYTEVAFLPFKVFKNWPTIIPPTFKIEAWAGYIFVTCLLIGGIWFIVNVSSLFARFLRIRKLSESIYSKDLDNFNLFNEDGRVENKENPSSENNDGSNENIVIK